MDKKSELCHSPSVSSSPKETFFLERFRTISVTPAWSGQITLASFDGRLAVIQVKNRFVRDWIKDNFIPSVLNDLSKLEGDEISIQLVVGSLEKPETPSEVSPISETPAVFHSPAAPAPSVRQKPEIKTLIHENLNPKYSFPNYVVGSSNQFAHAAAQAVARNPGKSYNPLFLYGGVGLGKTHLLNSIGLEILKTNPKARVMFMSAEKFMNELIYSVRFDKMTDFRKKYRDSCDVLLIDDIQFIAGKERTQEEFFHTFNHLYDLQKQIVLTSDKMPREIADLEERLRSRLEWGLIADIQTPDLETRLAILNKKAEQDNIALSSEVALFLASSIKSNVRELEGSLMRLNAFASLNGCALSPELAKDAFKNILSGMDRILTVEQVQKTVADFYKIKMNELTGKRRMKSLALPRQIAMYLCRKHVKSSYPEIGTKFGGKDHTTVIHAFSKIEKSLGFDPSLREQVSLLEQNICR